ncbi:MAG: HlyD family type I secretion periplasmic adaptor subunit [Magnetovibrio sp.]|nr:HlyD family type I secretion periplasmic adaptor subunit [Magnetovibrio sp.]
MEKLYAFIGSIQHYIKIAKEALRLEKEGPAAIKRKRQELEFLPAVLEVVDSPPSPLGRGIIITITIFFVIAVSWSVIGEVDIIATAQGKIIPSGKVKVIQPLESGVVRTIHVHDGQHVKAGDVLIELNPTGAAADEARLKRELLTAMINVARLEALLFDEPLEMFFPPEDAPEDLIARNRRHLESALSERNARLDAIDNEVLQRRAEIRTTQVEMKRLKMILPNVRERVEKRRTLLEKGYTARLDFLELEQELIDTEQQLLSADSKLSELQAAMRATASRRDQLIAEDRRTVQDQLSEVTGRAESLEQELIKAQDRNQQQNLTSPVDGVVQQLAIHTEGGVVTPAQELMTIVPAGDSIEIEAMVMNKDIGFVHDGQDAEIKVESFPFTKYGTLRGDVKTVSRDAVLDENQGWVYPARFNLWETEIVVGDKFVSLSPGMSVTVEIKTGKRKMIQYLLAPLQEYQDESLRER